jgi:hypothetical protein
MHNATNPQVIDKILTVADPVNGIRTDYNSTKDND